MALIDYDLFGAKRDKMKRAVEIARTFCPPEGYYLAYSGGKDSQAVKHVLDVAGVPYDAHYNATTVDPPELVRFIIRQFDGVIYDMPDGSNKYFTSNREGKLLQPTNAQALIGKRIIHFTIPALTMRQLIIKKKMPPTRLQRYCCEALKETHGDGRITVTGVRASESAARKKNQGAVTIFDGKTGRRFAEETGVNFIQTGRGGLFLITTTMRPAARLSTATAPGRYS